MTNEYLEWLIDRYLLWNEEPRQSHSHLASVMHEVPFVPKLRRDQNRASDGMYLRNHFTGDTGFIDGFPEECSMLELFGGIADRIEFMYPDNTPDQWFTQLLLNAKLVEYNDFRMELLWEKSVTKIKNRLAMINDRTYSSNGEGGLFPLPNEDGDFQDQREVEIWYQISAWLSFQYDTRV